MWPFSLFRRRKHLTLNEKRERVRRLAQEKGYYPTNRELNVFNEDLLDDMIYNGEFSKPAIMLLLAIPFMNEDGTIDPSEFVPDKLEPTHMSEDADEAYREARELADKTPSISYPEPTPSYEPEPERSSSYGGAYESSSSYDSGSSDSGSSD